MWKAIIHLLRGQPLEMASPQRPIVSFVVESGFLVIAGEFDTLTVPWDDIDHVHVFQQGELVA